MLRLIRVPLTDGQFDALVSFTFNLGAGALQCSTLHRQTNRGEHDAAALEFLKWVWAAGRQLPAGYWTIGYGHLCQSTHPPINESEAEVYLARDLQTALAATLRYCPVLATESENRLAAIADFTFNLGAGRLQTSTLRRRINQQDWTGTARELRRWIYGGGRVLPGLVERRNAEVLMLLL